MKSSAAFFYICCCCLVAAEQTNERRFSWISNVPGSPQEHSSFSLVTPGLTRAAFAFNGPSSHQTFSASFGNPRLTQKLLPNIAGGFAYDPALGVYASDSSTNAGGPHFTSSRMSSRVAASPMLATIPVLRSFSPQPVEDGQVSDGGYRASSFVPQHILSSYSNADYAQLGRLVYDTSVRDVHAEQQAQLTKAPQMQVLAQRENRERPRDQSVPRNLLGIAFSSAPAVARVEATGNGYKYHF